MQNVKAIILVASRDFGRCPVASRLPTAFWPVAGKSVLERLLRYLAGQGVKKAVVCGSNVSSWPDKRNFTDDRLTLSFFDESLPVGTAGCIREAARGGSEELLVVFPAAIVHPPEIDLLIKAHRNGGCDLTVMLNPCSQSDTSVSEASGIYLCNREILKHIAEEGYLDIKEGLIPKMLHAGSTVHAAALPQHAGNFRNRQEYLCAVSNYLENSPETDADLKLFRSSDSGSVWAAQSAAIDPQARISGPAVIMDGAEVAGGAVILGPAIIEKNVTISKGSVVINSVLWDEAQVGSSCQIRKCLVDYHALIRDNAVLEEESVPVKPAGMFAQKARVLEGVVRNNVKRLHSASYPLNKISDRLSNYPWLSRRNVLALLASGFVLIAFLWSYWPGLVELWELWRQSDEYSAGLLVPFLAAYILWSRRDDIACCPVKPSLWGLLAFAAAQAVRFFGLFLMYSSAERLSIVLSIAALILLLLGFKLFWRLSPIWLFLCLMLPLPNVIQYYVGLNLQRWATSSAVFCLETLGYAVTREGHTIEIGNVSVAVLEACNGLRMITAFFVISGLVVLLVERKWWEKLVILISSLPIALVCNTIRLAVTAVFFTVLQGEYWEKIFHDFGGYAMMPLALAVVVGELWLLTKLTELPAKEKAIIVTRQRA
jgi:exosortase